MFNPRSYGLPLPPNNRQLSAVRNSPVRALLARFRGLGTRTGFQTPPQVAPVRKQFIPGRAFSPIDPHLKSTRKVRDVLSLISEYAQQGKVVRLIYRKMEDGSVVQRTVEPYSMRYLRTRRGGRARYFYAWDLGPVTVGIHSFRMSNIMGVEGTDQTYHPRWKVEF